MISIGTYDPDFIKLADEIVKRYDVAREKASTIALHDIELTAYILVASPQGTAGDALPPGLDGVAKQLQSVFGYRDLKLLDAAVVRGHESHSGEMSGSLAASSNPGKGPQSYQLRFKDAAVRQTDGHTVIYLNEFRFGVRVGIETSPGVIGWSEVNFNTDLNITDSQKVVVGKSKFGSADQALILVLSARVVS